MNRTTGAIAAVVALLVILIVVDRSTTRDGDSVAIVGDSITFLDQGDIQRQMAGEFSLHVSATLGITLGRSLDAAKLLAGTRPQQVVIDLGSNDALSAVPIAQATNDLHAMVAVFKGADCIHLVNINTHMVALGKGPVGVEAKQLNDEIHKMADANSAIDIIDWDKIIGDDIRAHPPKGQLTADTIHPGPVGQKLLADELDTVLHRCGRPWQFW